jgi:propanediol dehydratase large subunit
VTRKIPQVLQPLDRVGEAGFESAGSVEFTAIRVDSRKDDPTRVDVSAREQVVIGPNEMHSAAGPLTVENALAVALVRASAAHEWGVVAQLARELEARRLAAAGVRSLLDERGRYLGKE